MEIATYSEFQKNDFTVVAQPILVNFTLPVKSDGYIDMSALSMDCFHGSQNTYALCKFFCYIFYFKIYQRYTSLLLIL